MIGKKMYLRKALSWFFVLHSFITFLFLHFFKQLTTLIHREVQRFKEQDEDAPFQIDLKKVKRPEGKEGAQAGL